MNSFYYYGFDSLYLLLVIPAVLIAVWSQFKVKTTFSKYSEFRCRLSGAEAARRVLEFNGVQGVKIERVSGNLTDHYDPKTNVIRLSDSVYSACSIAAVGVACHEAGHAVQYAKNYFPIKARSVILPICNLGSQLSIPLLLLGLVFNFSILINLGIISNVNIYSEIKRKLESNYISICDINTGLIENTLISIHFVGFLLFFWMLFPLLGLILLSLLLFKGCSKDEGEIIDKKDIIEVTEENDKIKPSLAVIDDTEETTYADNLNVMSFEFPFGMIVDKSSMTGYFDFYAPERGNKDIKVEIWYGDECLYSSDILKPGDNKLNSNTFLK